MVRTLGMVFLLSVGLVAAASAQHCVFFSEYIEGTADNQALELFNPNDYAVDVGDLEIRIFFEGATTPGFTLSLAGYVIEPLNGLVIVHSSGDPDLVSRGDIAVPGLDFNGDDAVQLWSATAGQQDLIGEIGIDPGTSWGGMTQNCGLQRQCRIRCGWVDDSVLAFEPLAEWIELPCDEWHGLGYHCGAVEVDSATWGQVKAIFR